MPKVNVSIQVVPRVEEARVYPVVDKVIAYIKSCNVVHVVGPMDTTIEGEYDDMMVIVKRCMEICIEEGATRVMSMIKVDYKPEGVTIDEKINKYR